MRERSPRHLERSGTAAESRDLAIGPGCRHPFAPQRAAKHPERSGTAAESRDLAIGPGCRHPFAPQRAAKHPERYVLGKPHADRAKQFKPFAALRGYEALVAQVMAQAAESHDFFDPEEPC